MTETSDETRISQGDHSVVDPSDRQDHEDMVDWDDLPAFVGSFLPDGRLLYANALLRLLIGIHQDEVASASFFRGLSSDARNIAQGRIRVLDPLHSTSHWEQTFIDEKGNHCVINWQFRLKTRANGHAQFIQAFGIDNTDRKKAETELGNRERYLQKIFDILPVGLWYADKHGTLLTGNPAGVRIWGAEPHVPISEYGIFTARRLPGKQEVGPGDWALAKSILHGETIKDEMLEIDAFDGVTRTVLNFTAPVTDEHNQLLGAIIVNQDITDLKHAEESARENEARWRGYLDNSPYGVFIADEMGKYLEVNPAASSATGYSREELLTMRIGDILLPESQTAGLEHFRKVVTTGQAYGEFAYRHKSGEKRYWSVAATSITPNRFLGYVLDISERKLVEEEREITLNLLRMLSQPGKLADILHNVITLMQDWSGCEAVGIRLKDGDDYPNFETRGFPAEFVRLETHLCDHDNEGHLIRDEAGHPVLECMCGNIIRGRFNPDLPFFTQNGSFWTNSTSELLASTSEADRQARTRNRCNGEGFESVALVPIRYGDQTLGLLQFNDKRKGCFKSADLHLFERLASNIAIGVIELNTAEKLRISEEALRKAQKIARIGSWEFDYRANKMLLSDEFRDILGIGDDPKVFIQILPGTSDHLLLPLRDALETIRKSGSALHTELKLDRKDESPIWVDFIGEPLAQDSEKLLGTAQDITGRKLAEMAMKDSEERFRAVSEYSHQAICIVDLQGRIVWLNKRMLVVSGYTREQILAAQSFLSFIAPESVEFVMSNFMKFAAGQDYIHHYHFYIIRADGQKRLMEKHMTDYADMHGNRSLIISMLDVTELRLAEAERERLLSAIEQSGETIVITDPNGTIRYVNPTFEKVTGYTRDEAVGRKPSVLQSGEHDKRFYADLWKTIASGKTWHGRFVNRRKDGTIYQEESTISPVFDENGSIMNFVAVKRDITHMLELESRLMQSQKMEAIGRLAGGVAHDLNNQLAPILGYGEMLLDEFSVDDGRRTDMEMILQAGYRARDMVRQLLAFSRKQALEFRNLDLNNVLEGFEKLLHRTIREDIKTEYRLGAGLPIIKGDRGQVEQVIMNLAVNAQDAMPRGGTLTIRTDLIDITPDNTVNPLQTPAVRLSVADNGEGMTEETRQHLFEPFFTTKEMGKGTGLGLATIYGIVKQHGGEILVESQQGQGSVFRVFFPVTVEVDPFSETLPLETKDMAGTETILLVEDNEQVRMLTFSILKRHGYKVLMADSGKSALSVVEHYNGAVDLLLTDVIMPDMSGRELSDHVAGRIPPGRVLFMSGYTRDVVLNRGISGGVNYIQKPFTVGDLVSKVRLVLDRSR